jgi:hypothetical protein
MPAALSELLVPRATVVTPNSMEARRLAAAPGEAAEALALPQCAGRLPARGAKFVLLTGTHEPTRDVVNSLYDARDLVRSDRWERLPASAVRLRSPPRSRGSRTGSRCRAVRRRGLLASACRRVPAGCRPGDSRPAVPAARGTAADE